MLSSKTMTKILKGNFEKKYFQTRKHGFKKDLQVLFPRDFFFHDYIINK